MRGTRDELRHIHTPYPNDFDAWMMGLAVWYRCPEERTAKSDDGGRVSAAKGHAKGHANSAMPTAMPTATRLAARRYSPARSNTSRRIRCARALPA